MVARHVQSAAAAAWIYLFLSRTYEEGKDDGTNDVFVFLKLSVGWATHQSSTTCLHESPQSLEVCTSVLVVILLLSYAYMRSLYSTELHHRSNDSEGRILSSCVCVSTY